MKAPPTMTRTEAGLLLAAQDSVLSMRPEEALEILEAMPAARLFGHLDSELLRAFEKLRLLAAAVDEIQDARSLEADRYFEDRITEYQRLAWPPEPSPEDLI